MENSHETFQLMLDSVRRFVVEKLQPLEHQVADDDEIPSDIIQSMRDLGLFGLSIATEYGGLGLSMEEEVHVVFELGKTSPAFRSVIGTNVGIGSQAIVMAGTEAQKEEYLPKLASGEIIGSFALTEPDAGSDALALVTQATKSGDHYTLNGTKRYITNAPVAGLFSVMARTSQDKGASAVSCFLVKADTPGITIGKRDRKMGQAGAWTADVIFEDCKVPASALLGGEEGNGFRTAMRVLDKSRIHIGALCVGLAERLLADSVTYAANRIQFGKPVSEHQLIQAMIADSQTEILAARALVLESARALDRRERITKNAAASKMFATEMVGRVADRAVQIFGGAGYIRDYGVERFYRDVRLFRIFEGTTQIQQLIIARETIKEFQ